jgi:Bacterial capsule synthesis protein PGA_cap
MSYYGADPGMPERRPPYPRQPDPRAHPVPPGPPPPAQPNWDQPTAAGPGRGQSGGGAWQGDDRPTAGTSGGHWGGPPRWDSPAAGGGQGWDSPAAGGGQGWDSPAPGGGQGWDSPAAGGQGWDAPAGGRSWDAPASGPGRGPGRAPVQRGGWDEPAADRRSPREQGGRELAARDNRPPAGPPPARAAGGGGYQGPKKRSRARTTLLLLAVLVLVGGLAALGGAFVFDQKHNSPATAGKDSTPPVPTPAASGNSSQAAGGDESFTFSAVGDTIVAFGSTVPPNNGKGFFDDVKPSLAADLEFANVEEAITDDTGVRKCSAGSTSCHAFRAPPATAQAFVEAGFNIVGLANNHANDFGSAGLKNTKATLDSLGIKYTGPPGLIPVLTIKGIKVAVLAFSPYAWSNDVNNIPAAVDLVKQAASQADVVIVTAHVGAEGSDQTHVKPGVETYVGETRGDSYAFSHAVIDAGADLVQMQGPHVMRAMEFYKDKLIAYSMGNFAGYGGALQTAGVLGISGILHVTIGKDGSFKGAKLIATSMVSPGYPRMDPKNRAIAQVRSLTQADFPKTGAKIADDGTITPPAG